MKQLGRLKINHLIQDELKDHELKKLLGGESYCSCNSSITYNSLASYRGGYHNGNADKYWDESGNPTNP